MTTKISAITRRNIIDMIFLDGINIYGRLEEVDFLSRIWSLEEMPSTDQRFKNAMGDTWLHTVNNKDWEIDWVFHDSRSNLMRGDDETFLRFLCESIHPVVRTEVTEHERLCQLYNKHLTTSQHVLEILGLRPTLEFNKPNACEHFVMA